MTTSQTWTPTEVEQSALFGLGFASVNLISAVDNAANVLAQHRALNGSATLPDFQRVVEALRQVAQEGRIVTASGEYATYYDTFFVEPNQTEEIPA